MEQLGRMFKPGFKFSKKSIEDLIAREYLEKDREKERVGHYLHASSEQKLLEKVQDELLTQSKQQLLEKKHSRLDQAFVWNVFELHNKYLQYVSNALYIIPSFTRL